MDSKNNEHKTIQRTMDKDYSSLDKLSHKTKCWNCNQYGHKAKICNNSRNFSITKKSPNRIQRRKKANGKPKQEKERESACYPCFLNPSKKKVDAVKSKKIWKKKDNPKDIYTHGALKEGQEENKGTRKIVLKLVKVYHWKKDGFHMTSPF